MFQAGVVEKFETCILCSIFSQNRAFMRLCGKTL